MAVTTHNPSTAIENDYISSSPEDHTSSFSPVEHDSPSSSFVDDEPTSAHTFMSALKDKFQKTLDIGSNGSTLSASPLGSILQLSAFHPVHGIIVASPHEQFDGQHFRDPAYVRTYRSRMLDDVLNGRHGFGLQIEGERKNLEVGFQDNFALKIKFDIEGVALEQTISMTEKGQANQSVVLSSRTGSRAVIKYTFGLDLSVNRASYGQLTEGGPIPIPDSENVLELQRGGLSFSVTNSNLDAMVVGSLTSNDVAVDLSSQLRRSVSHKKSLDARYLGQATVQPGRPVTLTGTFRLHAGTTNSRLQRLPLEQLHHSSRGQWKLVNDETGVIIKRNLEYILGNCTVPVENGAICIITDHVALPLGWNRDNYYQICFLLDVYEQLHRLAYADTARVYSEMIKKTALGHLLWVYRKAKRPHGYWHRSYLATGTPKDGSVYQLDQQCYPLLEICKYLQAFPCEEAFVKALLAEHTVSEILESLDKHRDRLTGLYITDETPGDDAVEYPFHFSSNLLLWYTFSRLATTLRSLGGVGTIGIHELESSAAKLKDDIFSHFVAKDMFAYLTDGNGHHTFYHDANDLPTLFAPEWGFVTTEEERMIWRRTMDWGLSAANKEGYFSDGPFSGLGSVHTRGPWPLGYTQELIYAEMSGNAKARENAWRRIKGVMFWDGMFCEAVDGTSGMCISKAWFSWPGSILGSHLLGSRWCQDTI